MAGRNSGVGPIGTILLMLVVVLIPIVGHIILTVIILGDDLSCGEKVLWLLIVWLVWFIGPLLYLLIGQQRDRLISRLSS